ncbi:MAG: hypothetical protein RLZZ598_900 [Pseudomonadota bacterium]
MAAIEGSSMAARKTLHGTTQCLGRRWSDHQLNSLIIDAIGMDEHIGAAHALAQQMHGRSAVSIVDGEGLLVLDPQRDQVREPAENST